MKSTLIIDAYNSVMTIEHSPLKNFDPVTAHMVFQILAFIWSAIFSIMLGSYIAFGVSSALHIFFITGLFITISVFKTVEKEKFKTAAYSGRYFNGEHF